VYGNRQIEKRDVLVVEDEQAIRKMLARLLHHLGYQVITAENGSRVVELCLRFEPRLIFLDMMLPDMDAVRIVHELRGLLGGQTPHVVLMSGDAVPAKVLSELRIVAYLQKPFSIESVAALAKKYAGCY
jgi:CheY-like chemotaxis protein